MILHDEFGGGQKSGDLVAELERTLRELTWSHHENEFFEVRALGVRKGGGKPRTWSAWYTPAQIERAAQQVAAIDGLASGIYAVMNPIGASARTELRHLGDHFGKLKELPPKGEGERRPWATLDTMISRRSWLLVDCDPIRPADLSSTDAEKSKANELLSRIILGAPAPPALICDSSNGWHALFRIADAAASDSVPRLLKALAHRFTYDQVDVDTRVGNASRIVKLYETLSRKGPDTPARPHRRSRIDRVAGDPRTLLGDELVGWLDALGYRPEPAPALEVATVPFRRPDPDSSRPSAIERAAKWLERADPAVSGSGGHGTTFRVACSLGPGFDLPPEDCFRLMWADYNPRCSPPWSERELRHKVEQCYAVEKRRGWLLDAGGESPAPARIKTAALAGPPEAKPSAALKPTGPAPADTPASIWIRSLRIDPATIEMLAALTPEELAADDPPDPAPTTARVIGDPPFIRIGKDGSHSIDEAKFSVELRKGEAPDDPHRATRAWLAANMIDDAIGGQALPVIYWQGDYWRWLEGRWAQWPTHELHAVFAGWGKTHIDRVNADRANRVDGADRKDGGGKPRKANRKYVADMLMHLSTLAMQEQHQLKEAPAWIGDRPIGWPRDARNVLATPTAIVDITRPERPTLPPTPKLFNTAALATSYDPAAECPTWLWFLGECWPNDPEAPALLQEWFGYSLTPDTTYHKMFALIGVRRSGKSTVGRALESMLGTASVARPAFGDFGRQFGLQQLINKTVAIIGDARSSNRADQTFALERLLNISGEDRPSVDRKNRVAWEGNLTTKIMLLSNEPPRLSDPSGALASRFLFLETRVSFEGREDTELGSKLAAETSGILNWGLAGLDRLRARKRFTEPASSARLRERVVESTAPIRMFVDECCELEPGAEVIRDDLFGAWKEWAKKQGMSDSPNAPDSSKIGTSSEFGTSLLAAFSEIESPKSQFRRLGKQVRIYRGIQLRGTPPF